MTTATGESVPFDAIYDDALLESAMTISVRRWYGRYGWLMGSACAVNYAGIAVFIWFAEFKIPLILWIPLAAIVLAPFYFVWSYFRSPKVYAAAFTRALAPSARVVVDSSSVSIAMRGRQVDRRWSGLADIVELPDYFLLFRGRFSLLALPIAKKGASEEALQIIREAMRRYGRRS